MAFKDYISEAIEQSGLSLRNIVDELEKLDVKATPSYISQLRNGKAKPPSETMSRALSSVLKIPEEQLFLEGYLETAPDIILQFVNDVYYRSSASILDVENKRSPLLSDFILNYVNKSIDNNSDSLILTSDCMLPNIKNGSIIQIDSLPNLDANKVVEDLKQGDIVVVFDQYEESVNIGRVRRSNSRIAIVPDNPEFMVTECEVCDLIKSEFRIENYNVRFNIDPLFERIKNDEATDSDLSKALSQNNKVWFIGKVIGIQI